MGTDCVWIVGKGCKRVDAAKKGKATKKVDRLSEMPREIIEMITEKLNSGNAQSLLKANKYLHGMYKDLIPRHSNSIYSVLVNQIDYPFDEERAIKTFFELYKVDKDPKKQRELLVLALGKEPKIKMKKLYLFCSMHDKLSIFSIIARMFPEHFPLDLVLLSAILLTACKKWFSLTPSQLILDNAGNDDQKAVMTPEELKVAARKITLSDVFMHIDKLNATLIKNKKMKTTTKRKKGDPVEWKLTPIITNQLLETMLKVWQIDIGDAAYMREWLNKDRNIHSCQGTYQYANPLAPEAIHYIEQCMKSRSKSSRPGMVYESSREQMLQNFERKHVITDYLNKNIIKAEARDVVCKVA